MRAEWYAPLVDEAAPQRCASRADRRRHRRACSLQHDRRGHRPSEERLWPSASWSRSAAHQVPGAPPKSVAELRHRWNSAGRRCPGADGLLAWSRHVLTTDRAKRASSSASGAQSARGIRSCSANVPLARTGWRDLSLPDTVARPCREHAAGMRRAPGTGRPSVRARTAAALRDAWQRSAGAVFRARDAPNYPLCLRRERAGSVSVVSNVAPALDSSRSLRPSAPAIIKGACTPRALRPARRSGCSSEPNPDSGKAAQHLQAAGKRQRTACRLSPADDRGQGTKQQGRC